MRRNPGIDHRPFSAEIPSIGPFAVARLTEPARLLVDVVPGG
jgi:hypothetical protein